MRPEILTPSARIDRIQKRPKPEWNAAPYSEESLLAVREKEVFESCREYR
jgi:hypothetical protein